MLFNRAIQIPIGDVIKMDRRASIDLWLAVIHYKNKERQGKTSSSLFLYTTYSTTPRDLPQLKALLYLLNATGRYVDNPCKPVFFCILLESTPENSLNHTKFVYLHGTKIIWLCISLEYTETVYPPQ